jgi:flavin-dependent dehydrogenase
MVAGKPHLNIGIFDSRIHNKTHADLPGILNSHIRAFDYAPDSFDLKAHPERWFHEVDSLSKPNVLLTGDAAGIEPMLGEGISMALAYGPVAARTIIQAFNTGDFSFESYKQNILNDKLGKILRRNRRLAYTFYSWKSQILLRFMLIFAECYLSLRYRSDGLRIRRLSL